MRRLPRLVLPVCLASFLPAILSACAADPGIVIRDRPVEVAIPVPQPCVLGPLPAEVLPIAREISAAAWARMDARQKAAAVARKGLERQAYGEQLAAATAGCRVIDGTIDGVIVP